MATPMEDAQPGATAIPAPTMLSFCTVELRPAELGSGMHPGGRMVITSHPAPMLDEDMPVLTDALYGILARKQPFEAVYDFRRYTRPSIDQVRRMARWCDQHQQAWDTLVEAAAILIETGMFATITKGILESFMRIFPPNCPVLICHDSATADDFLRRHIRPTMLGRSESFHSAASLGGPFGAMDSFASIESFDDPGFGEPVMLGRCSLLPLENGDMQVQQSTDWIGLSYMTRRALPQQQGARLTRASSRNRSCSDLLSDTALCALEKPEQVGFSVLSLRTREYICKLDVQAMTQVALRAIADWLLFAGQMCSPPEPMRPKPLPAVAAC